jgi:outer membrane protein assembly factor BamB
MWLIKRIVAGVMLGMFLACAAAAKEPRPLVLAVMDPLAAPLSCPCVKGYAQRDYAKLGEYLAEKTGREVIVTFGETLDKALVDVNDGRADVVIGKRSVVIADDKRAGGKLALVADLTGKDGSVLQRGLIVVRADDPAKSIKDLQGYQVILGPAECDEKNAAVRALFEKHGITLPKDCPISASCSDGATTLVEGGAKTKMVTVISSYAHRLLEGCGTIKKGDLRIVGETEELPFISAFVNSELDDDLKTALTTALLDVRTQPLLRLAIETKAGFQPIPKKQDKAKETSSEWPGWRGANRDAIVARLPEKLPGTAKWLWKKTLLNEGLGGPAVAQGLVIVGDRDSSDEFDVFHAVDANTGERRWSLRYPAAGRLDYGNSPRATPLIHGDHAYLLGAFGHLHCVRLSDGKIAWKKQLREEFDAHDELVWGACSSPLIVDGKLIVNPGGPEASLVALEPLTGEVLWKTPGAPPAFASFIGVSSEKGWQLVGYDKISLGGWDVATGKRLWTITPLTLGDFNVPTPVLVGSKILTATENNGARLLEFKDEQTPAEVGIYERCTPNMHTPVLCGERVIAAYDGKVFGFAADDLRLLWRATDRAFTGHVSLIASPNRVLALTQAGELLILDGQADKLVVLSRLPLFDESVSLYTHPALVGNRLFVRGPQYLFCIDLDAA